MKYNDHGSSFILGLSLAVGLSAAGYFISQTLYNAKVALNTAEAKGLAEKRVKADVANWDIKYTVTGKSRDEISSMYETSRQHQATINEMLQSNGFEASEVTLGPVDYSYREYRDKNQVLTDQKHTLIGLISVETTKVNSVQKIRAKLSQLIAEGINIDNRQPQYRFTGLNDIKPDMLREATKNARIAANEFASNAGVKVGKIRSARQGSFFVRDAGQEYGDTNKIQKDVRVVTTITFYLTE